MSIVKLACPNSACRHYAEPRLIQADACLGHVTLRNEPDGRCGVCDTELQPYEDVLDAA